MLGEEAGLLADTLIGLNTIDFRYKPPANSYRNSLILLSLLVAELVCSFLYMKYTFGSIVIGKLSISLQMLRVIQKTFTLIKNEIVD